MRLSSALPAAAPAHPGGSYPRPPGDDARPLDDEARSAGEDARSPGDDATIGLQILPWVGFDEADPIVAEVLAHIEKQPGIRYEVGTMETVLTGPLDELLELVGQCLRLAHRAGAGEVLAITKILYQPTQKGCRLP